MAIAVDSLLKLPQGAAYHRKSGQAHAEVSIRGDTIYVTGTCDSLARQVEYYENLYHTARDALEHNHNALRTVKERSYNPLLILCFGVLCGLAIGLSFSLLFIKRTKRFNNKPQ